MNEVKVLEDGNVLVTIPISLRHRIGRKRVIFQGNDSPELDPLVITLARAFRWQALIDSGAYSNTMELSRAIGKDHAFVARTIRMTLLAPEIVHAIIKGNVKHHLNLEHLRKEIPILWEDQKKKFGFE